MSSTTRTYDPELRSHTPRPVLLPCRTMWYAAFCHSGHLSKRFYSSTSAAPRGGAEDDGTTSTTEGVEDTGTHHGVSQPSVAGRGGDREQPCLRPQSRRRRL